MKIKEYQQPASGTLEDVICLEPVCNMAEKVIGWRNEQIEKVWERLVGKNPDPRELKEGATYVKLRGGQEIITFVYGGETLAEAVFYRDEHETAYRFYTKFFRPQEVAAGIEINFENI